MKNKLYLLLSSICSFALISCGGGDTSISEQPTNSVDESLSAVEDDKNYDYVLNEDYTNCPSITSLSGNVTNWKDKYVDDVKFTSTNDISYSETYVNNNLTEGELTFTSFDDIRSVYYNNEGFARYVNRPQGFAITIPVSERLECDFSLGTLRSRLYNEDTTITMSYETGNPYYSWNTYRTEWLFGYLDKDQYYEDNNLEKTADSLISNTTLLPGYIVDMYSLKINNPNKIKKYYYNIAAIRKSTSTKEFVLIVMKSATDKNEVFDWMITTYRQFIPVGQANSMSYYDMEADDNPLWSDETKKYYQKLKEQEYTDWGFFTGTYPSGENVSDINVGVSTQYKMQKTTSQWLDYDFEIVPTYQHTSWYKKMNNYWPTAAAETLAGGNGFNGKPVFQYTYQFTDNNNSLDIKGDGYQYTPMFDIYRGSDDVLTSMGSKLEVTMRKIARQIKAYGKPVLFRLNNEMNTDWTSYCGLMTLLDTDIFQATWRIMYHIFEEEQVDNCIWIFNPFNKSFPYCSWGEDMCYFPGSKYVQALGLTAYRDNNANNVDKDTFANDYSKLFDKNADYWLNYPWIISEFGCGAGGSESGVRYRNQASQVEYVKGMFDAFADRENNLFVRNIKGAVWFSINDGDVSNQYQIDENLPLTIAAFKEGLNRLKGLRQN